MRKIILLALLLLPVQGYRVTAIIMKETKT